jgi:hypothetical protein
VTVTLAVIVVAGAAGTAGLSGVIAVAANTAVTIASDSCMMTIRATASCTATCTL